AAGSCGECYAACTCAEKFRFRIEKKSKSRRVEESGPDPDSNSSTLRLLNSSTASRLFLLRHRLAGLAHAGKQLAHRRGRMARLLVLALAPEIFVRALAPPPGLHRVRSHGALL